MKFRAAHGFALIATISIMVLLVMIALAMLSLSTIELRSSQNGRAMVEAQANARMALMMALGELQKYAGPDMRITAPADILDANNPPLTGAWRSWEGSDHEPKGRPIAPNYNAKGQAESNGGRFLQWLVSSAGKPNTPETTDAPSLVAMTAANDTIPLLAAGSLSSADPRQIHVVPTEVKDGGHLAWWVSGENQKARLAQPHHPRTNDIAGLVEMGQSHTVTNPEAFGLTSLFSDPEPHNPSTAHGKPARKAVSRQSMTLIESDNPSEVGQKFHDFTTTAVGLLTNSATGGWRKDLSILTEKWDDIYSSYPGGKLPLFRFTPDPGATSQVPLPTVNNYDPAQSNLYPWSEYSLILGYKQPSTYHAAAASWASLQSFVTAYKNFSYSSGVVKSPFVWDRIAKRKASSIASNEIYNYKHKQRLYPQIARFQFIVYAKAEEDVRFPDADPQQYMMNIMYVPIFTLWNPYNVTLEHTISGTLNAGQGSGAHGEFLGFGWRRSLPGVMAVVNQSKYPDPDTVPATQFKLLTPGNFQTLDWPSNYANLYDWQLPENQAKGFTRSWIEKRTFGCWLPEGTLTFKPGEAKIFSPEWADPGYPFSGVIRLEEGYDPTAIQGVEIWNRNHLRDPVKGLFKPSGTSGPLTTSHNVWFLMRTDRLTQPYRDRAPGSGFSLSFGDGFSHFGGATMPTAIGDEFHNITSLSSEREGDAYWPPNEVDEVGYTVGELASGPWIPIFSTSFGPRMTIGTGPGTKQNRPTKGAVQNNALASMVLSDPESGQGKDHPANNTFDFAYHSLSIGSTITPNLSDSEGYIATGYQSGDGLSRLIMDEIPLRSMASLVELQGWSPRGNNPYPPFQMNLIGNSDATPLMPKDKIVPPTLSPSGVEFNLQHDDIYCANHLLFDDYFVSSIAPHPQGLGGSVARDIETVYADFLKGDARLSNRAYIPIPQDQGLTPAAVENVADDLLNGKNGDGWLKVASRLEVEGLFNVNSTSVKAWKALLGHAKSRDQIALHGKNGIEATPLSGNHPVTRGSVASDLEAGGGEAIGGQFANASEYAGFRSLTDDQVQDLAEKVVEQVRLRGPFLSLSEFVNRQLSQNDDLALAGAVQSALNNMADDPMAELRDPANSLSDVAMSNSDPKYKDILDGVDYAFAEAAQGSSAYGAPGWIRQADILRPIAPILTARDDTFTIRAYGDAVDESGKVIARAWCEAVVKRTRDFCDKSHAADSIEPPTDKINLTFGRRFNIISFRWLNADEV